MNMAEMYITAYYERVKQYATISNMRFRGPAGRNWSDLDIVALPLPPLESDGKTQRVADVVQCKWRAVFSLGEGNEEWLDSSVVNAPEVHAEASRVLAGWPYRVILITTKVWLATVQDRSALSARLRETARKANSSCIGAEIITFEEIAEEWRHALGQAVKGWAEDPFSFQLQVLQLGQVRPPGRTNLPPIPTLNRVTAEAILNYRHEEDMVRQEALNWLEKLVSQLGWKVIRQGHYDKDGWQGAVISVWGATWIFLGSIPDSPVPVFSAWYKDEETLRVPLASENDITQAARRLYTWWFWKEASD